MPDTVNDNEPQIPTITVMPEPEGVYVSASSAEMARAEKWMAKLREKGIKVTSTWPEVIRGEGKGVANPEDASVEDRQKWALKDVREAIMSQVLWLLMPEGNHSFGATYEYAFFTALANQGVQGTVVSGRHKRSIFTAFSDCFDTDEEAFENIVAAFEAMKSAPPVGTPTPDPVKLSFNPNA